MPELKARDVEAYLSSVFDRPVTLIGLRVIRSITRRSARSSMSNLSMSAFCIQSTGFR